jgi:hypothetical protein
MEIRTRIFKATDTERYDKIFGASDQPHTFTTQIPVSTLLFILQWFCSQFKVRWSTVSLPNLRISPCCGIVSDYISSTILRFQTILKLAVTEPSYRAPLRGGGFEYFHLSFPRRRRRKATPVSGAVTGDQKYRDPILQVGGGEPEDSQSRQAVKYGY